MDYRGYHIFAEVSINQVWDFEETEDGRMHLIRFVTDGGVDEDNVADFTVEDPNGQQLDGFAETVVEAKTMIDAAIRASVRA